MWENADQNNSEYGHFSRSVRQDPGELIFNYSNTSLSKVEKPMLVKVLKFSIPPKQLNYTDYLVNFE